MTLFELTTGAGERVTVEDGLADGAAVLCLVDTDGVGTEMKTSAALTIEERRTLAAALDPTPRLSPEAIAEIERWAIRQDIQRGPEPWERRDAQPTADEERARG